jgi:membrane protein
MEILNSNLSFSDLRRRDFFERLYKRVFEEDILNVSAQVAFYFIFALFPLLLFLVTLSGLILGSSGELRQELFFYLRQVMPGAAYELVRETIETVTEGSGGGKLTLGLLIALWSASAGFDSIRNALNNVYNTEENRPYWRIKLQSLLFTLILTVAILLALAFVVYGLELLTYLLTSFGLPVPPTFVLVIIQFAVVLALLLAVFATLYAYAPAHEKARWVWVTPGAVIGVGLWILVSLLFRLYLQYFDSYNETYGSLGAVIILLLWLYLTALVILTGGVVNSILENISQERQEKAEQTDAEKADGGEADTGD